MYDKKSALESLAHAIETGRGSSQALAAIHTTIDKAPDLYEAGKQLVVLLHQYEGAARKRAESGEPQRPFTEGYLATFRHTVRLFLGVEVLEKLEKEAGS